MCRNILVSFSKGEKETKEGGRKAECKNRQRQSRNVPRKIKMETHVQHSPHLVGCEQKKRVGEEKMERNPVCC